MIVILAAGALLGIAPPANAGEIVVCGRSMRYEDQYCDARTAGRRWDHRDAARAHELYAPYALPDRAAFAWLAATNNWIAAREPAKAVIAFDRALAAGLKSEWRAGVLAARARAVREARLSEPR